jgi:hypothetical protein
MREQVPVEGDWKISVDVGFLLQIERPKDRGEGYEYKWSPLLQLEFGLWRANRSTS